jgi:cytochrome c551/c552
MGSACSKVAGIKMFNGDTPREALMPPQPEQSTANASAAANV